MKDIIFFIPFLVIITCGLIDLYRHISVVSKNGSKSVLSLENKTEVTVSLNVSTALTTGKPQSDFTTSLRVTTNSPNISVGLTTSGLSKENAISSNVETSSKKEPKDLSTPRDIGRSTSEKSTTPEINLTTELTNLDLDIVTGNKQGTVLSRKYRISKKDDQEERRESTSTLEPQTLRGRERVFAPFLNYWIPPHFFPSPSHEHHPSGIRKKREDMSEWPEPTDIKFNQRMSDGTPFYTNKVGGLIFDLEYQKLYQDKQNMASSNPSSSQVSSGESQLNLEQTIPTQESTAEITESMTRRGRGRSPCNPYRRSRSKSRQAREEKKNMPCRFYDSVGYCNRGPECHYKHDYQKPLDTYQLRGVLDALAGSLNRSRENQRFLGEKLQSLEEKMTHVDNTQQILIAELKKLSLTPRNANQRQNQPRKEKEKDLKVRANLYQKRNW